MLFQFGFYSSLLLIFFVHGLVYAILLFRKAVFNETRADKWLSLFLVLCILYITPWMVGFGGWYDNQPYRDILFYVPFQQLYFIGPVIFFYIQSLLNPTFRFGNKEWLHLLPGIIYLLFSLVMVVTDKLVLKQYWFLTNGTDPDFDTWYQVTGFASMLFYFFLSLRYYSLYKKLMLQVISYADTVLFRWARNFLLAFLIMLGIRLLFFVLGEFMNLWYAETWWYFLAFALLFYYIAISGYANSVESKVPFRPNLFEYRPALLVNYQPLEEATAEETEVIEITDASFGKDGDEKLVYEWKEKIIRFIKEEKAYENPELSLSQMARQLKTNPSLLSKMINRGFSMNFNDFINGYRIEAVKEKLKNGEQQRQTLLGIAYDCGFNSKATFNRAFKKVTGSNPKNWLNQQ